MSKRETTSNPLITAEQVKSSRELAKYSINNIKGSTPPVKSFHGFYFYYGSLPPLQGSPKQESTPEYGKYVIAPSTRASFSRNELEKLTSKKPRIDYCE